MSVEGEAAADALTGAMVASAAEPAADGTRSASDEPRRPCLNCGAALTGAYCASCGQSAHIHRTFVSLGHDILHSVFHFEGKLWRTIPELVFRPGRLTRRYIDGERAKFISPMALFLFTVFLMYGIFAFLPEIDWNDPPALTAWGVPDETFGNQQAIDLTEMIERRRGELAAPELAAARRAELELEIRELESSRAVMQAIATDRERVGQALEEAETPDALDAPAGEDALSKTPSVFSRAVERLEENPDLVFYKMQSNGYKWSWLLVPLSIPFIWLLFFWRRDFPLYDHAVFVTYSISFAMLLLIASTLADFAGAARGVQFALLMLVPPVHIYKQLRDTYRLSRRGALVRLFFLLVFAVIVLTIFLTMLLLSGALE